MKNPRKQPCCELCKFFREAGDDFDLHGRCCFDESNWPVPPADSSDCEILYPEFQRELQTAIELFARSSRGDKNYEANYHTFEVLDTSWHQVFDFLNWEYVAMHSAYREYFERLNVDRGMVCDNFKDRQ